MHYCWLPNIHHLLPCCLSTGLFFTVSKDISIPFISPVCPFTLYFLSKLSLPKLKRQTFFIDFSNTQCDLVRPLRANIQKSKLDKSITLLSSWAPVAFSVSPEDSTLGTQIGAKIKKKQHKKTETYVRKSTLTILNGEIMPYASLFFKKCLLFGFKYLASEAQKSITEKLRSLKCLQNATFGDRTESFYKGGNIIHWYWSKTLFCLLLLHYGPLWVTKCLSGCLSVITTMWWNVRLKPKLRARQASLFSP